MRRDENSLWRKKPINALVVGVGGSGSGIARLIGVAEDLLTIVDPDHVSELNTLTQGYYREHVGMGKVVALKQQIMAMNANAKVTANYESVSRFAQRNYTTFNVVISCVDSWDAREIAFELWKKQIPEDKIFITTGLLADSFKYDVYFPDTQDTWVSLADTEGDTGYTCTTQASLYMATLLHGSVLKTINQWRSFSKDFVIPQVQTSLID